MKKLLAVIAVLFLAGSVRAIADPVDFGDKTSQTLIAKAWAALAKGDVKLVETYVNKTVELYGDKAKEMQASLKEYPWENKEKIFSYWALNDVGTSLFILGQAYQNAGRNDDARKAYKQVVDEYGYAQCWDPQGWFWKPAEAAQKNLTQLAAAAPAVKAQ